MPATILKRPAIAAHVDVSFSIPIITKYISHDKDTSRIYVRAYLQEIIILNSNQNTHYYFDSMYTQIHCDTNRNLNLIWGKALLLNCSSRISESNLGFHHDRGAARSNGTGRLIPQHPNPWLLCAKYVCIYGANDMWISSSASSLSSLALVKLTDEPRFRFNWGVIAIV